MKKKLIFVVTILLIGFGYVITKPLLGFATNEQRLKSELNGYYTNEDIEIIYSTEIDKNEFQNLILSHLYYFNEIKKTTLIHPKKKITSFIFKNKDQKRKLFGAGNADVAKPWLYQTYVDIESYQQTLKHELAHVFSAEIGKGILRLPAWINPAMIEGYAMAVENDFAGNDIHYMAYLAKESGYDFPINQLFTGLNFLSKAPSISYIFSGSFMKYLSDTYGIDKANKVYSDLDFEKHFQISANSLENDYYLFLKGLDIELNVNTAKLFFGRKTIFKKHCVRYTAKQLKEAWNLYNKEKYSKAITLFEDIYAISESYSSLIGIINCKRKLEEYQSAQKLLENEIEKFESSSPVFNLKFVLADLFAINDDFVEAEKLYSELLNQNPSENYYNISKVRFDLLKSNQQNLREYLLGDNAIRYNILSNLYLQNFNVDLLPVLLRLSVLNKKSFEEFNDKFLLQVDKQKINSGFVFQTSQYLFEVNNYKLAEEYAKFAVAKNDRFEKISTYEENLNQISWLLENKNKFSLDEIR